MRVDTSFTVHTCSRRSNGAERCNNGFDELHETTILLPNRLSVSFFHGAYSGAVRNEYF